MRTWSSVILFLAALHCRNYVTGEERECKKNLPCKPASECKVLEPYMQGIGKELIQSLHCGFSGQMLKVCCPVVLGVPDSPEKRLETSTPTKGLTGALLPDRNICGYDTTDRILGGTLTDIREHPWTALLEYITPRGSEFVCGGVLISSRYVLTAAHCVQGTFNGTTNPKRVRLGEWNTATSDDCQQLQQNKTPKCADTPVDIEVEQIIPHPEYTSANINQLYDIALLRLRTPASFTNFIQPICLPTEPQLRRNSFKDYVAVAVGWGKTRAGPQSDVKLKVELPVVSNERCQSVYRRLRRVIDSKQLCAGGDAGKDTCGGDSGGPLMYFYQERWTLIGVVSYGPKPCGFPGWPGVYSRITEYLDWINQNISP